MTTAALARGATLRHSRPMANPPAPPSPAPLERQVVVLVALIQLVNVLDFVMVMPLGQDFAHALAIPESQLGLVGGSYTLAAAISGLISSRFLDRFDRRTALTVAMLGLVTATAAGGLAQGLGSMMAARVLAGVFGGPATSLSLAIIADVVPPARRGRAMSTVMVAFPIASVLGIPIALAVAQAGSWRTPFFGLAVFGLAVTGFGAVRLPSLRGHLSGPRHVATTTRALLRRKEMLMTIGAAAAMTFSVFMIVPFVRTFLENNHGYPPDRIMFLYLAGGVAAFVTVRFTGRIVDRVGATPVATFGTILLVTCIVVGFVPARPIAPVMLIFVLFMCTASLRGVPLSTLASRLPAPHERAQYMSLQSATQHLASSLGAVVASRLLASSPDRVVAWGGQTLFTMGGPLRHMPTVAILSATLAMTMPLLLWRVERRLRAAPAADGAAALPVAVATEGEAA